MSMHVMVFGVPRVADQQIFQRIARFASFKTEERFRFHFLQINYNYILIIKYINIVKFIDWGFQYFSNWDASWKSNTSFALSYCSISLLLYKQSMIFWLLLIAIMSLSFSLLPSWVSFFIFPIVSSITSSSSCSAISSFSIPSFHPFISSDYYSKIFTSFLNLLISFWLFAFLFWATNYSKC